MRQDQNQVVYVDGDVPQLPLQLGQLLVDSSLVSPGNTNLQQCTSQSPLIYEGIQGYYPQTPSEAAAGVVPTNYFIPSHLATGWVAVERYGADPTGVLSSTAALDNAVLVSSFAYHATVRFFCGRYRFGTKPANIGYGIMIEAPGSQGTNQLYGAVLLADFDTDDFLVWDGSGAPGFRGTGGGLKNVAVLAADGRTAGRGIYLYAISSTYRPGEMFFENVLVFGEGTATWTKCIEIDGRNANNPADGIGVRTVRFNKVRCADATTAYQTVHFRQAVHVSGQIDIDTGNGTPNIGLTIDDVWDNIMLSDERLGHVVVNYSGPDNPTLLLNCRVASFTNNSTRVVGSLNLASYGAAGTVQSPAELLRIRGNMVDSFWAYLGSTAANQTGDGTVETVVYDTENYDENATFDTATGIPTFRIAGKYQVNYGLVLTNLAAGHTTGEMTLVHRDSGGGIKGSLSTKYNVGAMRDAANQCSMTASQILSVEQGDTMEVVCAVSGSTRTVGFGGAGATQYGGFSARLFA